jgi:plastocyanin
VILRRTVLMAAAAAMLLPAAAGAAERVHRVAMSRMAFGPAPPDLKRGDVVEWVNDDIFRHTATSAEAGFDVDLAAGAKGRSELKRAGTFVVRCRYHPGMTLRLAVRE